MVTTYAFATFALVLLWATFSLWRSKYVEVRSKALAQNVAQMDSWTSEFYNR